MRSALALFAGIFAFAAWTASAAQTPRTTGAQTNAEAAKLKNPVKPTPAAIAAGKAHYEQQCVMCHGDKGKGDGKLAPTVTGPPPADFTDSKWKHGSTDGEIFTVIKNGVKGTGMRSFLAKLQTETEIWNVVHYVKTLGPRPAAKKAP
jgi:mono/diheme cytochrome c family protein